MHIVKRKGHQEKYDERKVYASAYAAGRSVHLSEEEAEVLADQVTQETNAWFAAQDAVSSQQIFEHITQSLDKHNSDAAFMYKTHRDVS